jgi:hypothetical protein
MPPPDVGPVGVAKERAEARLENVAIWASELLLQETPERRCLLFAAGGDSH